MRLDRSFPSSWIFVVAPLLGLTGPAALSQTVLRVDADAPPGGDGSSWPSAFNDLQDALDAAAALGAPAELWIAQGRYIPGRGSRDRDSTFDLIDAVSLYGGFAGGETSRDQRDPNANLVVLSGDLARNDGVNFANYGDNAFHVLTAGETVTAATVLDGLIVTAGNADFDGDLLRGGGGMWIFRGSPILRDCRFTLNRAGTNEPDIGGFGGGIYVEGGSPEITRCSFERNRGMAGGAFALREFGEDEFHIAITDCTFLFNFSEHQTGGAAWTGVDPFSAVDRQLSFVRCLFDSNQAQYGGAIFQQNVLHFSAIDCTFLNNTAAVNGGAVNDSHTGGPDRFPDRFERCTFINNNANERDGGGGVWIGAADAIFDRCVFRDNAAGTGGAIRSGTLFTTGGGQTLEVYNSLFHDNRADIGAAIWTSTNEFVRIANCTIVSNSASVLGAAFVGADSPLIEIHNSILWANDVNGEVTQDTQIFFDNDGVLDVDYCDVQGLSGGPAKSNIDADPRFVNAGANDFHLRADSPCLDAADNTRPPSFQDDFDLDGAPRYAGAFLDMGAFEAAIGPTGLRLREPTPGRAGRVNALDAGGAEPGRTVHYAFGLNPGSTPVPGCPGAFVAIANAQLAGSATADEHGFARLNVSVPNAAAGRAVLLQAVDRADCAVSNFVETVFD